MALLKNFSASIKADHKMLNTAPKSAEENFNEAGGQLSFWTMSNLFLADKATFEKHTKLVSQPISTPVPKHVSQLPSSCQFLTSRPLLFTDAVPQASTSSIRVYSGQLVRVRQ